MDGHRAPREANKADLAKEVEQGQCVEHSVIDLIVGTIKVRNNGRKRSLSSHHCNLRRFGNSDDGVDMNACMT